MTNPQDGHILNCDPYQATCGFSLRILPSSRIANSAINRPKEMLIAFIKVPPIRSDFVSVQNAFPHARLVEVKNVSTETRERQALSNLMRCSRSCEPIMTHDSLSLMSLFPTVSCWRSGNLLKRLCSCVGMSTLLEWFLLFLATMASSHAEDRRLAKEWRRSAYINTIRLI